MNNKIQQIEVLIARSLDLIDSLVEKYAESGATFDNFVIPLEFEGVELSKLSASINHLSSVDDNEENRKNEKELGVLLSSYYSKYSQNTKLYKIYKQLQTGEEYKTLDDQQKLLIDDNVKGFELGGVALNDYDKVLLTGINELLTILTNNFADNVLDSTNATLVYVKENQVSGIPKYELEKAKNKAKELNYDGYVFDISAGTYSSVMTYADDRKLRKRMRNAKAFVASDLAEDKKFDNTKNIIEILKLRHQKAKLLGFNDYTELSLATKMASNAKQIEKFQLDLVKQATKAEKSDYKELKKYGKKLGIKIPRSYDNAYISEKIFEEKYSLNEEALREYFPEDLVLSGLFDLVHEMYGIDVVGDPSKKTEVPAGRVYAVFQADKHLGDIVMDLYARPTKAAGAWMGPIEDSPASCNIVCNFTEPLEEQKSYLKHSEMQTLFHEFGHALHHVLSEAKYPSQFGTNVEWDFVELPSQFMENFCYTPELLKKISCQKITGEKLSDELIGKIVASKNYQAGMIMVIQNLRGLLDLYLHWNADDKISVDYIKKTIKNMYKSLGRKVSSDYRFAHGFTHIFAGGYAVGYYGYKFAEVLSADVYEEFVRIDKLNEVGDKFRRTILSQGSKSLGSALFKDFMGREPDTSALLRSMDLIG